MAKKVKEGVPAHFITDTAAAMAEGIVEGMQSELAAQLGNNPELVQIAIDEAAKQSKKDLKVILKDRNNNLDVRQLAILRAVANKLHSITTEGKKTQILPRVEKVIKAEQKIHDEQKKERVIKRQEDLSANEKRLIAEERALLKQQEELLKKKVEEEKVLQEQEEEFIRSSREKAKDYRHKILDIEEEQRKIYEDSVAESEMESRVIFDRSNKALEELIQFSKENSEQIDQFSSSEKEVLEEIRDLLKKSRTASMGDLPGIRDKMSEIYGKADIHGRSNPEFQKVINNTTKITDKLTSRVSVFSKISQAVTGGFKERIRETYEKVPVPLRMLMETATPFITNPIKRFAGIGSKETKEAARGRGQIEALSEIMRNTSRDAPAVSGRGFSTRLTPIPSISNAFTKAKSGGKGNIVEIPELKVGKFNIGILNIQEIDEDGALENLLKGNKGGGGLFGKIANTVMDVGGNVLGGLAGLFGLKKLRDIFKGAGTAADGAKTVAEGAKATSEAVKGASEGAKVVAESAGAAKAIAGASAGAGLVSKAAGAIAKSPLLKTLGRGFTPLTLGVAGYDIYNRANQEGGWKSMGADEFEASDFYNPLNWLGSTELKLGMYAGGVLNDNIIDPATKLLTGSDSLGGWLYEKFGGGEDEMKKALAPTPVKRIKPPSSIQANDKTISGIAAEVATAAGITQTQPAPIVINNNNITRGGGGNGGGGGALPTSMNSPRAQESSFVRYMMRSYAQI